MAAVTKTSSVSGFEWVTEEDYGSPGNRSHLPQVPPTTPLRVVCGTARRLQPEMEDWSLGSCSRGGASPPHSSCLVLPVPRAPGPHCPGRSG